MLTLDILRTSEQLSLVQLTALWTSIGNILAHGRARPKLVTAAVEAGIFDLAVAQLRSIGTPAEMVVRRHTPHCLAPVPHASLLTSCLNIVR